MCDPDAQARKEDNVRIHHLNCISMCPYGGKLLDGRSRLLGPAELVCHCLLLETRASGLALIDTGFGLRDVQTVQARLSPTFLRVMRPALQPAQTALRQIEKLGFKASDVRHIGLTHLDFDHAGGLDDFPSARVHLLDREVNAAATPRTWIDRQRFRPSQWSSRDRWRSYEVAGQPWFGFSCVRQLDDLHEEVFLVPLPGHTMGHAGVAVGLGRDRWLLHCGDAYFYGPEMRVRPRCTPGLRLYQTVMDQERRARLDNQIRLRALKHAQQGRVRIFCAHDAWELQQLQRGEAEQAQPKRARLFSPTQVSGRPAL